MKKRNVFMAVALLIFGLNLEADNSSPNLVLKVPVDVYIPNGVHFIRGGHIPEITGSIQELTCMLYSDSGSIEHTQKTIRLHNGQYTVSVEYYLSANSIAHLKRYECKHIVVTQEGHYVFSTVLLDNQNSNIVENNLHPTISGTIE